MISKDQEQACNYDLTPDSFLVDVLSPKERMKFLLDNLEKGATGGAEHAGGAGQFGRILHDDRINDDEAAIIAECAGDEQDQRGQEAIGGEAKEVRQSDHEEAIIEENHQRINEYEQNRLTQQIIINAQENCLNASDIEFDAEDEEQESQEAEEEEEEAPLGPQQLAAISELQSDPIIMCVLMGVLTSEFNDLNVSDSSLQELQELLQLQPMLSFPDASEHHGHLSKFIQLLLYSHLASSSPPSTRFLEFHGPQLLRGIQVDLELEEGASRADLVPALRVARVEGGARQAWWWRNGIRNGDLVLMVSGRIGVDAILGPAASASTLRPSEVFLQLTQLLRTLNATNQRAASLLLGYVTKLPSADDHRASTLRILINSDPALQSNLQRQQELVGCIQMKMFVVQNLGYFQQLFRGLNGVQDQLDMRVGAQLLSLKKFNGLRMIYEPKLQKPVLYRTANALDKDQGKFEKYIYRQMNEKILFEAQKRALKHVSALQCQSGDMSLIQGGPGTGKTFLVMQAMEMLLSSTDQRVCILLPDQTALINFCNQVQSCKEYFQDFKKVKQEMVILTQTRRSPDEGLNSIGGQDSALDRVDAKMRGQKIETKTLETFLKLEKRPDREQIANFLGFENWEKFNQKFQFLARMLRTTKAGEELLRICLCTHKILTIENMLDPDLFKQNDVEKQIYKRIKKYWNLVDEEYRDEIYEQCREVAEQFRIDFCEANPDFDPDCLIQADKTLLRVYKHKLKMTLVDELQTLVTAFYSEIQTQNEEAQNLLKFIPFKTEVLPALRNYLLSNCRLVVTSIHDDLCKQNLWSAQEHMQRHLLSRPLDQNQGQTIQIKQFFDIAIVDDANRVPELEMMVAMHEMRPGRMVLVGDAQSKNIYAPSSSSVSSMYDKVNLGNELYVRRSLFERMIVGEGGCCTLINQMRLNKQIFEFAELVMQANETKINGKQVGYAEMQGTKLNEERCDLVHLQKIMPRICFYDLKYLPALKDGEEMNSDKQECLFILSLLSKIARICIDEEKNRIIQSHKENGQSEEATTDKANASKDAKSIVEKQLTQRQKIQFEISHSLPIGMSIQKLMKSTIGIIVPYERVIRLYKEILSRLRFVSNLEIQVGLPQEFMGVEKDLIIVSHLRPTSAQSGSSQANLGAFTHGAKVEQDAILNLAMTRAKKHLWMVGNLALIAPLQSNFERIFNFCLKSSKLTQDESAMKKPYQPFESADQWKDKTQLAEQLFSHCRRYNFGGYTLRDSDGTDQFLPDDEGANGEKEKSKHADMGNITKEDLLTLRADQDQTNFLKKQTGAYISGGYLKKDADGGQYNRGNNMSAYTNTRSSFNSLFPRHRRQDGTRFRGRFHRGGMNRNMGGRQQTAAMAAAQANQAAQPGRYDRSRFARPGQPGALGFKRSTTVMARLHERYRDRQGGEWDEQATWGDSNTAQKRQRVDHDRW